MALDLTERRDWAVGRLRELADPERRKVTEGYFPTAMEILGVSAPRMRSVLRMLLGDLKGEPPSRVLELAWLLRDTGIHEARQVAYELLDRREEARRLLSTRELKKMGAGNDNWASVDTFACTLSGPAWREGQISDKQVLSWTRLKDLWWRRTALVSTVPLNLRSRGGTGDPGRTLMVCRVLAGDREPMVAKGLSWALRSLVGVDRDQVGAFLKEYDEDLPALVKREVTTKLETGRKNR